MDKAQKQEVISSLREKLSEVSTVVVVHNQGLTVSQITRLRKQMREVDAGFQITKNSLLKLAVLGTPYEGLKDLFEGPTAIAYSKDPVAAAKTVVQFAKDNEKLVVRGGVLEAQIMNVSAVESLATLPSLDELRGRIVGLLCAPATKIAQVLQAPGGQVARVLSAYAASEGGN